MILRDVRMSNNFAVNLTNSSRVHSRRKLDNYPTPSSATIALLKFLDLPKSTIIWEPACGIGEMSKVITQQGYYSVVSTDLYNYDYGIAGIDFTKTTSLLGDWIITNPPFNLSAEFIENAHKLEPEGFAFLLKSQYWHAAKRLELFNRVKPAYILPLTWRLDFLKGERGGSPTMDCLWTVWIQGNTRAEYVPLEKP